MKKTPYVGLCGVLRTMKRIVKKMKKESNGYKKI